MGRLAVVILLANVGLLALAQSTQRWRQGSSSRNAAGTEKGTDVCSRGEKQGRDWKLVEQKWKKIPHSADYSDFITLTQRLLL